MSIQDEVEVARALHEDSEDMLFAEREPILKKAVTIFKRILRKEPDNLDAHFELARVYLDLGEFETALLHAQRVLKSSPKEPNIRLNTGVIYRNMDDTETGLKFYKKELALYPDCPEVYFNLGLVYFERHRWKTAAKYWEQSFQLKYRVDDLIVDLAVCYRKTNEVEKEINVYRSYLKDHPQDDWAMENLGAALIDVGQYDQALTYLRKAKKVLPDEPMIQRNIELALRLRAKRRAVAE